MKSHLLKVFVFAILTIFSSTVFATKPISPEMVAKEAELIVEGKIGFPIQCADSKIFGTACSNRAAYLAPLKIKKIIQGKNLKRKSEKILVCTGGPTAEPVSGDEGIYYLKTAPLIISSRYFQLIYSDEVIHAAGVLPTCK